MTFGCAEQLDLPDTCDGPASRIRIVDPGWTGIIEVLVSGLGGVVRWDPDSVVLQLPDNAQPGRVGDLDVLRLCLGQVGLPVLFDALGVIFRDASLVEFLGKLVESGLMVDVEAAVA